MSTDIFNVAFTDEDLGHLQAVRDVIWTWRSHCMTPVHLLAIGGLLSGLDALLEGGDPDGLAMVSLSYDYGEESRSVSVSVTEEGVELCHSAYHYLPNVGGDNETIVDARFEPSNPLDETGVFDWLNHCAALRGLANGLETEIYQLPRF